MKKKFGFELLAQQALDYVDGEIDALKQDCKGDSEIEKLFYHAIHMKIKFGEAVYRRILEPSNDEDFSRWMTDIEMPTSVLMIRRQVQLEAGRVDFIISAFDWNSGHYANRFPHDYDFAVGPDRKWRHLVVECDGHDFHERTKEQAAKDRSRDRKIALSGMEIFRFTGSELWRDPWGCVEQVIDWARKGMLG